MSWLYSKEPWVPSGSRSTHIDHNPVHQAADLCLHLSSLTNSRQAAEKEGWITKSTDHREGRWVDRTLRWGCYQITQQSYFLSWPLALWIGSWTGTESLSVLNPNNNELGAEPEEEEVVTGLHMRLDHLFLFIVKQSLYLTQPFILGLHTIKESHSLSQKAQYPAYYLNWVGYVLG